MIRQRFDAADDGGTGALAPDPIWSAAQEEQGAEPCEGGAGADCSVEEISEGRRTLGFLLREGSRLMRRRFVHHTKRAGLGLNRSEASLLLQVFYEPGVKQVRVATLLDMETISVVRLVDGLEEAGLLERRPHPKDRRIRTLWLTNAGEGVAAQVVEITKIVRGEAFAGLSDAESDQLLDLLVAVRRNLLTAGARIG
ncbi:MAG TPA: MarR family transcriptional regulator [Acetobacteraceae bacterium]|jgi:MarR family transcriptional regulator for hemolysin|nr:MarR family transcriptional regulator [Acetobacteraceae bacterium]